MVHTSNFSDFLQTNCNLIKITKETPFLKSRSKSYRARRESGKLLKIMLKDV